MKNFFLSFILLISFSTYSQTKTVKKIPNKNNLQKTATDLKEKLVEPKNKAKLEIKKKSTTINTKIIDTKLSNSNSSAREILDPQMLSSFEIVELQLKKYIKCLSVTDDGLCKGTKDPKKPMGEAPKFLSHALFQAGVINQPGLKTPQEFCDVLPQQGFEKVSVSWRKAQIGDIFSYDTKNTYGNIQIRLVGGWYSDFLSKWAFKHKPLCVLRKTK